MSGSIAKVAVTVAAVALIGVAARAQEWLAKRGKGNLNGRVHARDGIRRRSQTP